MNGFANARMLFAALAVVTLAPAARAGLLPVAVSVAPDGEQFRWTYNVVLTSDSELQLGDYFTIYDFRGFVGGSNVQPAGFDFATSQVGPTPDNLLPQDDPEVVNLTYTYTGPETVIGAEGLGNFSAISTFGKEAKGYFTAITHRQIDGNSNSNVTETDVPVPGDVPTVAEPATLALVGVALPLWSLCRRRRLGGE